METVRTRIAPSPTGGLHIGHVRTILYDYALAKKSKGQFIVRIEDTDQKRYVEGAVDSLLDVIEAYGLSWDEGPRIEGPYSPYIQSQRLDIYKKYALELVSNGYAYYCFMDVEETEELQERSKIEKRKLRSPYREYTVGKITELLATGRDYVIRLKVPDNEIIEFEDEIIGKVSYNSSEVDDQILLKSDGFPTYHLAVVVDDYLMNMTYILRGNDWIPSTPKHILLYRYLGWGDKLPKYAHLPNLKEKDSGKKLSKRHGAVFAIQFLEAGYLPDAMLNFLMLLGWSSPEERVFGQKEREIYSLKEFVNLFSLDRVQKTALISFDRGKLVWFNKEYIKMKSPEELSQVFLNWLEKYAADKSVMDLCKNDATLFKKLQLVKERSTTLVEMANQVKFFYNAPESVDWNIEQVAAFKVKLGLIKDDIYNIIVSLGEDPSKWVQQEWVDKMRAISQKYSIKGGDSFMVLRLCIVGSPFSPSLFEAMQLMSKSDILNRITKSI